MMWACFYSGTRLECSAASYTVTYKTGNISWDSGGKAGGRDLRLPGGPGTGSRCLAVGDSLGRDWGKKEICEDAYILVQAREGGSLHTGPRSEKQERGKQVAKCNSPQEASNLMSSLTFTL